MDAQTMIPTYGGGGYNYILEANKIFPLKTIMPQLQYLSQTDMYGNHKKR